MSRQLKVLYTIFELELAPPFELIKEPEKLANFWVHNRHSTRVGTYDNKLNEFIPRLILNKLILERVKRTFNADKLSNEDVYNITKHLVDWLQDKLPVEINRLSVWNHDANKDISYEKEKKQ